MKLQLKLGAAVATFVIASAAFAQTPAAKPTRIRGEIVSLTGDTLTVHRRSGDTVTIDVKSSVPVTAVKNIKLEDIKPGSFVPRSRARHGRRSLRVGLGPEQLDDERKRGQRCASH
jgi:hypothetical protein